MNLRKGWINRQFARIEREFSRWPLRLTTMDHTQLKAIRERLAGVSGMKPWRYNPDYQMLVGTTNALETYELGAIDLGGDGRVWERVIANGKEASRLTDRSLRRKAELVAFGQFLERCREDIVYLLTVISEREE